MRKAGGFLGAAVVLLAACAPAGPGSSRLAGADGAAATAATYLGAGAARGTLFDTLAAQLKASERSPADGLARLGTNWDQELARTRTRFLAAQTVEEAYLSVLSLKISFHDAHSQLDHEPGSTLRGLPAAMIPTRSPLALRASVHLEYDGATPRYLIEGPGVPRGAAVTA